MRVIYMGTPDFAVPCLNRLVKENYDVVCVVTQPDKKVGRKQILTFSDVKKAALEAGLNVYQPDSLKPDDVYEKLKSYAPDYIVVAAYGKILPKRVLELPKYACINVHGSLLPEYRGAAPIQRAVLDGKKVTGITTMLMNEGLDTGDILLTYKTDIGPDETSGELFDRLASAAPDLLIETLKKYTVGALSPQKQDDSLATYASMLSKDEAMLDFNAAAETVHNKVRGMSPWPVAFFKTGEKTVKVITSRVADEQITGRAGELKVSSGKLYAVCADGALELVTVQPEGKKPMTGAAYAAGHKAELAG